VPATSRSGPGVAEAKVGAGALCGQVLHAQQRAAGAAVGGLAGPGGVRAEPRAGVGGVRPVPHPAGAPPAGPAALRAGGPRGHAPCAPVQRCAPSPLSCGLLQAADASGVSARQVERGASAADVRRAYRQLSLVYHPVRRRGRLWAGCAARPPVASAPGAPYYGGEQGWLRPAGQEPRPGGRQVLCGVHNKGVQGAHGCARPPRKPRAALAPSRRPPAGPVPAWGLPDGGPRPQTRPRARTMRSTATRTGRSPSSWTSRCRTGSSRRRAPLNQARRSEHRHAL